MEWIKRLFKKGWPDHPYYPTKEEFELWKNAKIGDNIKTPWGEETITEISDTSFSTNKSVGNGKIWEGQNWRTFKPIQD
jgi:hypothetical protein